MTAHDDPWADLKRLMQGQAVVLPPDFSVSLAPMGRALADLQRTTDDMADAVSMSMAVAFTTLNERSTMPRPTYPPRSVTVYYEHGRVARRHLPSMVGAGILSVGSPGFRRLPDGRVVDNEPPDDVTAPFWAHVLLEALAARHRVARDRSDDLGHLLHEELPALDELGCTIARSDDLPEALCAVWHAAQSPDPRDRWPAAQAAWAWLTTLLPPGTLGSAE